MMVAVDNAKQPGKEKLPSTSAITPHRWPPCLLMSKGKFKLQWVQEECYGPMLPEIQISPRVVTTDRAQSC